ncbi:MULTISPECIES: SfnB family sulfur acquisition oxidoreductase [unclassified Herbaspirillum]|uniref:SfnB family sulfur acquisition oxidoreductase n=1 Tax=unclassified Herbaspirillum TaxID=2624150 RepID=UPI000E2E7A5D|nr:MULTISPECIES: SfnB family sulfur acquisition oxidoreductase [unclassified Herbaspirillum]RFB67496.1 SfnB family sulfur acquisition oxidoreductase [Herbaspirillum sp. 3R-3a1]TFI05102.1 SfnB family sulfur acquisition oxidoreductase [Herbaspirillum sp. 3R11]TFI12568.1 SfnB family sulfur acquisition oxidoreductase [Herbaspirillum sp. 3R-11]TFI21067.1 SfnB family sulfur acquisition oxidoreductase [Herbaspirillum sp. 3C11]
MSQSATATAAAISTEPRIVARIRDDAEALAVARKLAVELAREASQRDRERRLPWAELDRYVRSGLWGISVPKEYGGAGVSYVTLAQVTAIIAEADGSLGQIPQNHFYAVEIIRVNGSDAQKRFYFERVLQGDRFGNALAEIGTKNSAERKTRLTKDGADYRINGHKFYATGALYADWVPTSAIDDDGVQQLALVPRNAQGLSIVDDWSGFGQRTTGSGSAIFDNVRVDGGAVLGFQASFDRPTTVGPLAQLLHAAIDLGIARAAYADLISFVSTRSRPWIDSGVERAGDDPLTIREVGDLTVQLHAAEALVDRAGAKVDIAAADSNADTVAAASIAVAESRVLTNNVSLAAGSKLFELAGTQSTLAENNLDRHWRNARTHTLHDPVRWKYHAIGNYYLNDKKPPRHGAL